MTSVRSALVLFQLCIGFQVAKVSRCLADVEGPRGIYALGPARDNSVTPQDDRLSAIRDYDFLSGYTLRVLWQDIDLGGGVYDFSVVDKALAELQQNQFATKLNLELLAMSPPQYIQASATETWEHFNAGVVPVPWDLALNQGHANLVSALANHLVYDATVGAAVPLPQHSALEIVDASLPGISSIRDNFGSSNLIKLVDLPNYNRELFIDTVVASVARTRNAFSDQFGFVGYFGMSDDEDANWGTTLDEALLERLMSEYNNSSQPTLGLFQELLSDVGPDPSNGLGANLLAVSDQTYILFQALTSWLSPFTGADKVTSMNPATGIERGFNEFGATFFEIYLADIEGAVNGAVDAAGNPLLEDLRTWSSILAVQTTPGDFDLDGDVDGTDLLLWQHGFPTNPESAVDLADWMANFDAHIFTAVAGDVSGLAVVPEPHSALLMKLSVVFSLVIRSPTQRPNN